MTINIDIKLFLFLVFLYYIIQRRNYNSNRSTKEKEISYKVSYNLKKAPPIESESTENISSIEIQITNTNSNSNDLIVVFKLLRIVIELLLRLSTAYKKIIKSIILTLSMGIKVYSMLSQILHHMDIQQNFKKIFKNTVIEEVKIEEVKIQESETLVSEEPNNNSTILNSIRKACTNIIELFKKSVQPSPEIIGPEPINPIEPEPNNNSTILDSIRKACTNIIELFKKSVQPSPENNEVDSLDDETDSLEFVDEPLSIEDISLIPHLEESNSGQRHPNDSDFESILSNLEYIRTNRSLELSQMDIE